MKLLDRLIPDYDRVEHRYYHAIDQFHNYDKKLQVPLIAVTAYATILFYLFNEYIISKTKEKGFFINGFSPSEIALIIGIVVIGLGIGFVVFQLFMAYSKGLKGYSFSKFRTEQELIKVYEQIYEDLEHDYKNESQRYDATMLNKALIVYNQYQLTIDEINALLSDRDDYLLKANETLFIITLLYMSIATVAITIFLIDIFV